MRPIASALILAVALQCPSLAKGRISPQVAASAQEQPAAAPSSALLSTMKQELDREFAFLKVADPPAYYVGYVVTDSNSVQVSGSNGAVIESAQNHERGLEARVRVGSYELDNTHNVGQSGGGSAGGGGESVPIEDDPGVLRRAMWRQTDTQYRDAAAAFVKIESAKQVQAQTPEQAVPDFSRERPETFQGPIATIGSLDRRPWEEKVRLYTRFFRDSPAILNSIATFSASADNQYHVTSEGTRLQFGYVSYRLEISIQGKAPDGMEINRYYNFDWTDPSAAPPDKVVLAQCAVLQKELESLVKAPLVEPFAGPTMLTGRAAAVFFHEVFGHRDEGFRQKQSDEGQTFAGKVGERILPEFISIIDDPTMKKLGSSDLLGYYVFDDEGVRAQRVTLVDRGVLRNFEMSRQPILGFANSNGHGRRQVGLAPVSRQGNLIVQSSHQVSNAELKRMLIDEIRRQGKPFGLLIDDIAGGFTFTGRSQPQAFQVEPLVVYEVFPDGRPDMLVRGVDIVGTPLVSLTQIIATGDTTEVFNGFCGAESGSVPVSASAPAMLIGEMEVQKKQSATDRPPILPPPAHDAQTEAQPRS